MQVADDVLDVAVHSALRWRSRKRAGILRRAMSQENVEIVRAIYEAAERRDWDRAFRDQHPDVVLTTPPGIDAGTYRGRTEIQRFWEDWFTVFEERSSAHPEQFVESGDKVAVVVRYRAWPKGGSRAIEIRNGHVWSLRDGEVVSMRMFPSPDEALDAVGLRE